MAYSPGMARPAGKRMFGPLLRYVLRLKGISMTEAAELCEMPLPTFSGLVSGSHKASDKTIRRVCDALAIPDEVLFPALCGWAFTEDKTTSLEDAA